jgi:hypothetical protein
MPFGMARIRNAASAAARLDRVRSAVTQAVMSVVATSACGLRHTPRTQAVNCRF